MRKRPKAEEEELKPIESKCKCKHGTCAPGAVICNKCDAGWTGVLCDVPKDKKFNKK